MAEFSPECFEDDFVKIEMKELQHEIDVSGVSNIKEILPKRLESWREEEVNVAITGDSGSGKSSFINAIRELHEDDDGAAPVDVDECTREPTAYDHPTNSNIKFWDLPGIGTPNYPDMETYVQKVQLEKYHTFLIFTSNRFTRNDLLLAEKIRSMKKSFFFVRTKIDDEYRAQSRKRSFNEEAMLMEIRRDFVENIGDLLSNEEEVFLISNHEIDKWDFVRLTQAILSLGKAITRSSAEIFQRKVNVLKGRIWKVAAVSAAAAIAPFPRVSVAIDNALILNELRLYRSQLGLPEEGSAEFAKLPLATKEKVKKVALTTSTKLIEFLEPFVAEAFGKKVARYLPVVSMAIASGMSFGATYYALHKLLGAVEDAALSVLREAHEKTSAELEID
ncbi:interferon-inducible GTPase 5-like isoform X1 [Acropora millepora]|uniref:interferon-inducible GTPase 5-like isoform X1 n=1 Tax=Acropora millepora TaxID=45264 RepID=UPI001CF41E6C|nr:interferon-inducible GTPase 5-like isoform X1 [Acropora millepora]